MSEVPKPAQKPGVNPAPKSVGKRPETAPETQTKKNATTPMAKPARKSGVNPAPKPVGKRAPVPAPMEKNKKKGTTATRLVRPRTTQCTTRLRTPFEVWGYTKSGIDLATFVCEPTSEECLGIPLERGEFLISRISKICSRQTLEDSTELTFKVLPVVSMAIKVDYHLYTYITARIKVDDADWQYVPAVDEYGGLQGVSCTLPAKFKKVCVCFSRRLHRNTASIGPKGGVIRASVDKNISIQFPQLDIKQPAEITLVVNEMTRQLVEIVKQMDGNLVGSSDMIEAEGLDDLLRSRLPKPIQVSLSGGDSCKHNTHKPVKARNGHIVAVLYYQRNWHVDHNVDNSKPHNFIVPTEKAIEKCVVIETKSSSDEAAIQSAINLDKFMDQHKIRLIQKQHKRDQSKVVTDCVETGECDEAMKWLEGKGFTEGPICASGEIIVKENQSFVMSLRQDKQVKLFDHQEQNITFTFNRDLRNARREFYVAPRKEDTQSHFYLGVSDFFKREETSENLIHSFEFKLPNSSFKQVEIVGRAQTTPGAVDHASVARTERSSSSSETSVETPGTESADSRPTVSLSGMDKTDMTEQLPLRWAFLELVEMAPVINKWKTIGRYLKVPESELTAIDIDNQRDVKEKVFTMLSTWREQNVGATIDQLIKVLRELNLNQCAELLHDKRQLVIWESSHADS